jgi:D-tyrosyl-tRNA(Tyr) deacylase
MKAVIQRVKEARVSVGKKIVAKIGQGIVILLGIEKGDSEETARYLADKIILLRIFENEKKKMDLSLLDIKGEVLVVSQFTLYGDTGKGRRPSFTRGAGPEEAKKLYENFIAFLREHKLKVATGIFGAKMLLEIHNDGPVTFIINGKKAQ